MRELPYGQWKERLAWWYGFSKPFRRGYGAIASRILAVGPSFLSRLGVYGDVSSLELRLVNFRGWSQFRSTQLQWFGGQGPRTGFQRM